MGRSELRISNCEFRIEFKPQCCRCGFQIRNSTSRIWWRRRELNPDPKANAEGLYMLICFAFRTACDRTTFAQCRVSEAARPRPELVRLNLAHCHGPKQRAKLI